MSAKNVKRFLFNLIMALFLMISASGVHPVLASGNVPWLDGNWDCGGGSCWIGQTDVYSLELSNGILTNYGYVSSSYEIVIENSWGGDWNLGNGVVSQDEQTITWGNGDVWTRPPSRPQITVIANSQIITSRTFHPEFTSTYSGFIDSDGPGDIDVHPFCGVASSYFNAGSYVIHCYGAADDKYDFIYVDGVLTVLPIISKFGPPNELTDVSRLTWLSWEGNPDPNTIGYEYCLTTSVVTSGTSCPQGWVPVSTMLVVPLDHLVANTTYYWQVRSVSNTGVYLYADDNTWWWFRTSNFSLSISSSRPNSYDFALTTEMQLVPATIGVVEVSVLSSGFQETYTAPVICKFGICTIKFSSNTYPSGNSTIFVEDLSGNLLGTVNFCRDNPSIPASGHGRDH
jgi:hypothetical protein